MEGEGKKEGGGEGGKKESEGWRKNCDYLSCKFNVN